MSLLSARIVVAFGLILAGIAPAAALGTLADFQSAVFGREASGKWDAVNPKTGYLGAGQMGKAILIDLGYVKNTGNTYDNWSLNDSTIWTGKNGVTSKDAFLSNQSAQLQAINEGMALKWGRMEKLNALGKPLTSYVGTQMSNGTTLTESGLLGGAQFGEGKVQAYLANGGRCVPGPNSATNDASGVCVEEYMSKFSGYDVSAITKMSPQVDSSPGVSQTDRNGQPTTALGASDASGDMITCWACEVYTAMTQQLDAAIKSASTRMQQNDVQVLMALIAMFALMFMAGSMMFGNGSWTKLIMLMSMTAVSAAIMRVGAGEVLWTNALEPLAVAIIGLGGQLASAGSSTASQSCGNLSTLAQAGACQLDWMTTTIGRVFTDAFNIATSAGLLNPKQVLLFSQGLLIWIVAIIVLCIAVAVTFTATMHIAIPAIMLPTIPLALIFERSRGYATWCIKEIMSGAMTLSIVSLMLGFMGAATRQILDKYHVIGESGVMNTLFSSGASQASVVAILGVTILTGIFLMQASSMAQGAMSWISHAAGGSSTGAALAGWIAATRGAPIAARAAKVAAAATGGIGSVAAALGGAAIGGAGRIINRSKKM
ncbi:hypothetical protein [Microvirga pudoricolor]|uniref:hypothetical protein n=1 Tax=Microvirga pudoricolor TaxID=2778729 RepID=UPI00194F32DC|nr:hypothetical protein [Microvirga pudoricolor]MBM6595342.1 hypothetical protein [Microvirga pudoricolor]